MRMCENNSRGLGVYAVAQYKAFLCGRKCRGCISREARLCLSSHRLASVIPPMFSHHLALFCTKCNLCVLYATLNTHYLRVTRLKTKHGWFLTTVAGTKKHGCSAESPSAACRASVQYAPLEGYVDSRGCCVASRKTSRVFKKMHAATRLVM